MCDTMVALGNQTADGAVLFAKNSDRDFNEAHEIIMLPAADQRAGTPLHCTYIDVPQVAHTFAVLLAKPFWIWGAEMGANEHGVVIGNEAVFTRIPYEQEPGLIGMDFLRLALERASSARAALDVITNLLETHGQGGNCGYAAPFFYHNSFLIADPHDAWVLETAGRHWVAERVVDVRSISNALSIGSTWDLASHDLVNYAVEQGWCSSSDDFHFGRCYADPQYARLDAARTRECRSLELLRAQAGRITQATMMAVLRDHGPDAGDDWSPVPDLTPGNICMHGSPGQERRSQSTGSMVSQLTAEQQTHWLTGTSAPCTGIFKPVWIDAGLPDIGPAPVGHDDGAALWWRHEALHRTVMEDYPARLHMYRPERDALEAGFIEAAVECRSASVSERITCTGRCFGLADQALERWSAMSFSSR